MTKRIDKVRGYLVSTYERAAALNLQDLSDATWFAVFEEFYSPYNPTDDIMGRGDTEEAAKADLLELPWAKWWQENPPQSDAELDARLSAMRPFPRGWLKLGEGGVMSGQLKLRPSPVLDELIALTGSEGEKTARLNTVAQRYMELIEACTPDLQHEEWSVIFAALTAEMASKGAVPGAGFWWVIVDDRPELCDRYGVDGQALVVQLQAWGTAEEIAAEEMLDRHWAAAAV